MTIHTQLFLHGHFQQHKLIEAKLKNGNNNISSDNSLVGNISYMIVLLEYPQSIKQLKLYIILLPFLLIPFLEKMGEIFLLKQSCQIKHK